MVLILKPLILRSFVTQLAIGNQSRARAEFFTATEGNLSTTISYPASLFSSRKPPLKIHVEQKLKDWKSTERLVCLKHLGLGGITGKRSEIGWLWTGLGGWVQGQMRLKSPRCRFIMKMTGQLLADSGARGISASLKVQALSHYHLPHKKL